MRIDRRRPTHEVVPVDSAGAIVVREFELPFFDRGFHIHPEVELTLILRGRGMRFVHDSIANFTEGDLCLIGAHAPHAWLSDPTPGETVRSLVLQFGEAVFGDVAAVPVCKPIVRLLKAARRGLRIDGATRDRTTAAMLRLQENGSTPLRRYAGLLAVLADIADSRQLTPLASAAVVPASVMERKLARILDHIHAQPQTEMLQADMARRLRMSTSAFSRYFVRRVGKTYVDYVAEVRVARACQQLVDTDAAVAEIAFAVGFGNLANFNRWFKRVRGMTPTQYRARSR